MSGPVAGVLGRRLGRCFEFVGLIFDIGDPAANVGELRARKLLVPVEFSTKHNEPETDLLEVDH